MDARNAAQKHTTTEDRAKAAFKAARNHFMAPRDEEMFQGAVAAIYELSDEQTQARIVEEMQGIKTLNAILSGVDVNLDNFKPMETPIGLMKLFRESVTH